MSELIQRIRENYRSLDDEGLIRIHKSGDLTEDALAALNEEMSSRGLSEDRANRLEKEREDERIKEFTGTSHKPFPLIWVGFLLTGLFLLSEFIVVEGIRLSGLIFFAGNIYWLFCIYRLHQIVRHVSLGTYDVSPSAAAGYHFIPFFNIAWFFIWPTKLSNYISEQRKIAMLPGFSIGLALFASLFIGRIFDGAVGLAITFSVIAYVSGKVREATLVVAEQQG